MFGGMDVLESRTSHLSARMIEEKVFEEHPFWEGGGLVLCEPYPFIRSIHSAKRMFFYSSFSSYNPEPGSIVLSLTDGDSE